MKPAAFEMARPQTVHDALALLADEPDSKLLAGGQSLVPVMNFRLATPSLLIDLNRIPTLANIFLDCGMLRIGAMVRQSSLLESPIVAAACALTDESHSKYWARANAQSRNNAAEVSPMPIRQQNCPS